MKRAIAIATIVLLGCDERASPPAIHSASDDPAPPASSAGAAAAKPEIVMLPAGVTSGRDFVRRELSRAQSDGRTLVIYVGATWCEPCQRFHSAVKSGELDRELAGVRFLELDHDDHAALLGDGDMACASKLIPLFVRPNDDGSCGARRVEGAIKGDGAVRFILPKLRAILDR